MHSAPGADRDPSAPVLTPGLRSGQVGTAMNYPRSAYEQIGGLYYFARMLDKIRLHEAGKLPSGYVPFLEKGNNQRISAYLHIDYQKLVERVKAGGSDEEILEWAYENGRRLNEVEIMIWNQFARKRGWNDEATETLAQFKQESGLSDRDEIQTMFDYYDAEEGRPHHTIATRIS
jgi:hypothetical protein